MADLDDRRCCLIRRIDNTNKLLNSFFCRIQVMHIKNFVSSIRIKFSMRARTCYGDNIF